MVTESVQLSSERIVAITFGVWFGGSILLMLAFYIAEVRLKELGTDLRSKPSWFIGEIGGIIALIWPLALISIVIGAPLVVAFRWLQRGIVISVRAFVHRELQWRELRRARNEERKLKDELAQRRDYTRRQGPNR